MQNIPNLNSSPCAAPSGPTDNRQADVCPAEMTQATASIPARSRRTARLLLILEGGYDVSFLKRIRSILHAADPQVPDLRALEQAGTIVFVPIGGSNFIYWTERLSGLGIPEFFLLDREVAPLTEERVQAVEIVNSRAGCRAVLTGKRAAENYIHPEALLESRGLDIAFGDDDDVPQLVAREFLGAGWRPRLVSPAPSRSRRPAEGSAAKRWLEHGRRQQVDAGAAGRAGSPRGRTIVADGDRRNGWLRRLIGRQRLRWLSGDE